MRERQCWQREKHNLLPLHLQPPRLLKSRTRMRSIWTTMTTMSLPPLPLNPQNLLHKKQTQSLRSSAPSCQHPSPHHLHASRPLPANPSLKASLTKKSASSLSTSVFQDDTSSSFARSKLLIQSATRSILPSHYYQNSLLLHQLLPLATVYN